MNASNKASVEFTKAGAIKTAGCRIVRGMDTWIVSSGSTYVGSRDSYDEAEALASSHLSDTRERVEALTADLYQRRAERNAEEASGAQRLGIRCTGTDEDGNVTFD